MTNRSFRELAAAQWRSGRFLCVGLDSDVRLLPEAGASASRSPDLGPQARFNQSIVDATCDIAGAFKPNSAFYEALGHQGISDLRETVRYINTVASDVPVILDAKRADIGNTNSGYVEFAFDYLGVDAITVHPYLGRESLLPFLDRFEKGIFVLCRTSNPGAGEFQDLEDRSGQRLFERVAMAVATSWNTNANCGLVVGSTYPKELARIRELAADLPLLIPGIGAQGGELEASVRSGLSPQGDGIFLNASRSIIFSSDAIDFAETARAEAKRLHNAIRGTMQGD